MFDINYYNEKFKENIPTVDVNTLKEEIKGEIQSDINDMGEWKEIISVKTRSGTTDKTCINNDIDLTPYKELLVELRYGEFGTTGIIDVSQISDDNPYFYYAINATYYSRIFITPGSLGFADIVSSNSYYVGTCKIYGR